MTRRRMVLLCYSHDSEPFRDQVRQLADRLRNEGVNAQLDQFMEPAGPSVGWARWIDGFNEIDAILAIGSPAFKRRVEGIVSDGLVDADQAREIERLMARTVAEPEGIPVLGVLVDDSVPEDALPDALAQGTWYRIPKDYYALCAAIGQGDGDTTPVGDGVMPASGEPEELKTDWRDGRRD